MFKKVIGILLSVVMSVSAVTGVWAKPIKSISAGIVKSKHVTLKLKNTDLWQKVNIYTSGGSADARYQIKYYFTDLNNKRGPIQVFWNDISGKDGFRIGTIGVATRGSYTFWLDAKNDIAKGGDNITLKVEWR